MFPCVSALLAVTVLMVVGTLTPLAHADMSITSAPWGQLPDGKAVTLYTLSNSHGMTARISDFGGLLVELIVPDKAGKPVDVVLGKDSLKDYLAGHPFFGVLVGRYANRIAGGTFSIDGKSYSIPKKGKHAIHGGPEGFDKKVWAAETSQFGNSVSLVLKLASPDEDMGFPGKMEAQVTYTLDDESRLSIDYSATCDQPTIVNLTNHSYFHLGGQGAGDVLSHELVLHADSFTATDADLIPTGELMPVKDTPLDFTEMHPLGERITADFPALQHGGGYDHNYVLSSKEEGMKPCARVRHPGTGIVMEVQTTQPGVQLYTANGMKDTAGKNGARYPKHGGFCLETQHYPDSPHQPSFPSTVLRPGQSYEQTTTFQFSIE
jgi:aldose 1-epimerase